VLARHAGRVRSRRSQLRDLGRALSLTLLAAVAAAPLAAVWGISHAQVEDYLGPHRASFASNFNGEVKVNLGPIGNAYLDSPVPPIGLTITVGGVGGAPQNLGSLFSEQTLAAYTSLYTEPEESISGIVERLTQDAVQEALKAEAVLLLGVAIWRLRRQLFASWIVARVTTRRAAVIYLTVLALVVSSILIPQAQKASRYPVCSIAASKASSCSVGGSSER
jgi:hypothetical protein